MNKNLILRLPPKTTIAVYMQILLVMLMLWLRDFLSFPSAITYLTDIIMVFLVFRYYGHIKKSVSLAKANNQLYIIFFIILCMAFGATINLVNPLHVLWGARNNLRFFAFFLGCIGVLRIKDIDSIIRIIKIFFWLNVIMCTYQYFSLGLSNDYLGGFFGSSSGCNAYINILLCMVISIITAQYFAKKERMYKVGIYALACIYIATLAEIKVFYIELLIIFFTAIITVRRPTLKVIIICAISIIALYVALLLLNRYNPRSVELLFDESARDYYLRGNGYSNSGDLNRFTAIQQLYEKFFKGDALTSLFGFGLGSCDYAKYDFLQSSFYKQYNYLHYRWFSHAWVYLEQGAIGLILMVLFFISLGIYTIKHRNTDRKDLINAALYFIPTCLLGMIYNCALEIEACYLIAFMCAIPFVIKKCNKGSTLNDNYRENKASCKETIIWSQS